MSRRAVVVAVLGVLLATSCTTEPPGQDSRDTSSTARPPADHNLREVRIPYRDGIASVWPETAAQAICQALSEREWGGVLGGSASRSVTADYPVSAGCEITTDTVKLTLHMTDSPLGSVAGTTESIAGHPARIVVHNERTLVEAAVELVPATQPRPVLSAIIETDAAPGTALDDLLRRALAAVLPKLLPDGPTTPVPDATTGQLTFPAPVPAVPLSDLPAAAQALAVCTALVEHTSPAPAPSAVRATVEDGSATCQWRQPEWVWATLINGTTETSTEIAGHPAQVTDDKVSIELLDGQALLVLHRPGVSADALRTWAEQVVPALGKL